jgi:protein-histidine pros-kinase
MTLLFRVNLAFAGVFTLGALVAGYAFWHIIEQDAQRQVLAEAGLMMDSALATRAYTASEVLPLLNEHMNGDVPPQSIPYYAATQNFIQLRSSHPGYNYKEATLNPTNPRDRAADWEADIIQRFVTDPATREVVGERETPMGPVLFLARPIRSEAQCAGCHSLPALAPHALIARYGSGNGFGWRVGEIVGAQVVTVPLEQSANAARHAFRAFMVSLVAVFCAVFLVVNAVLYLLIVKPIRQIAVIAEQVSLGDPAAPGFPAMHALETASLLRSFERMRKSLDKALRLLDK